MKTKLFLLAALTAFLSNCTSEYKPLPRTFVTPASSGPMGQLRLVEDGDYHPPYTFANLSNTGGSRKETVACQPLLFTRF